jgi:signal transduction histidine kinase
MPHGGTLELSLAASGEELVLSVADTGTGIAPAMLERLFRPFASTKPTGTGLGLSICKRIVEEHGGTICGANRTEGGACFTLTLPAEKAVRSQESGVRLQESGVSTDLSIHANR